MTKNPSSNRMGSFKMRGALYLKDKMKPSASEFLHLKANSTYKPISITGKGAFGVVYCAKDQNGDTVAIKKVLLDPRYKNRELEMISTINHINCITLKDSFKTKGKKKSEIFLNIVMDFFPQSLYDFANQYRSRRLYPPIIIVKLFAYQMFAGLCYLHSIGIAHRDIKPPNILINQETGVLKICDFGSAKMLKEGEKSVSYIASRFYRAPELILDCQQYTSSIDIWSAGCVIAEVINAGTPLFVSDTSFGQINAIVKLIGEPTEDDMASYKHNIEMPNGFQQVTNIKLVLPSHTPEDILDLLSKIFVYNPKKRISAYDAMKHPCFADLFIQGMKLQNGSPFPTLYTSSTKVSSLDQ